MLYLVHVSEVHIDVGLFVRAQSSYLAMNSLYPFWFMPILLLVILFFVYFVGFMNLIRVLNP